MGAPAIPIWKWIDWSYKDLITKNKLAQMMEDIFYAYQCRVKNGDNKKGLDIHVDSVAPLNKVNILADALSIQDIEIENLDISADITISGAGGLDTGSEAPSTWYAIFVIHNQLNSLIKSLLSTSATSPVMPTNYIKKRRVGWIYNDASSNFIKCVRVVDWVRYDVKQIVVNAGTAISFTAASCASYIPPTSTLGDFTLQADGTNTAGGAIRPTDSAEPDGIVRIRGTQFVDAAAQTRGNGLCGTNTSQSIDYKKDGDGGVSVWVTGYYDPV